MNLRASTRRKPLFMNMLQHQGRVLKYRSKSGESELQSPRAPSSRREHPRLKRALSRSPAKAAAATIWLYESSILYKRLLTFHAQTSAIAECPLTLVLIQSLSRSIIDQSDKYPGPRTESPGGRVRRWTSSIHISTPPLKRSHADISSNRSWRKIVILLPFSAMMPSSRS